MDFALTEDQAMLRDSLRRSLAGRPRPALLNAKPVSDRGSWRTLAELGVLLVGQPERFGGIGDVVEIAIVAEELGRAALSEPFASTAVFAAQLVSAAGREKQKAEWLPAISAGDAILTVAHRDAAEPATARRLGDGSFIVQGRKKLAVAGPSADRLLVTAGSEAGNLACFVVDPVCAGVSLVPTPLVDGSWACDVILDRVELQADSLLGEGDCAAALATAARYETLACVSELLGLMESAMTIAAGYADTRQQFGQPIGRFQALRHKFADMAIDVEMTRAAVNVMIASFQDPESHSPEKSALLARVSAVDTALRVCGAAIQIHGGMGMTEECGVGRYFARANVIASLLGPTYRNLAAYSDLTWTERSRAA